MKHGDLVTDGGVTWKLVDSRVQGYIAEIPNFYKRSGLFVPNKNTITTPTQLLVNINNHGYITMEPITLDLDNASSWDQYSANQGMATRTNRAGKDIYIYAVEQTNSDIPKFELSLNSTTPSDASSDGSRKIGGFHCLYADVSNPSSGHPLSGYQAGNILPLSVWDLRHRPVSSPEGMVFVDGINKWVDIYLNTYESSKLQSLAGKATADGSSSTKFHGEKFVEELGKVGKELPTRDEFIVFAKGSNEGTNISGNTDPVYTGGHVDTTGKRMISNYGVEDCCGFLLQWTNEFYCKQSGSWTTAGVYNSNVDSQSYGSCYADNTWRADVGGDWVDAAHSGSRCTDFGFPSSDVSGYRGARGVSKAKRF